MIKTRFPSIIKWSALTVIAATLVGAGILVGQVTKQEQDLTDSLRSMRVGRVIDGDTIELSNGEVVRYLDIDTPETVHPDKPVECYGQEATDRNRELVEGHTVYLDVPPEGKDNYGRTLAYVYTNDHFVNGELVWNGFAYSRSYASQGRLYQTLVQLERAAREDARGMWGHCE